MKTVRLLDADESEVTLNNIFCIGRNYVAHIRELNNAIPEQPLVFLKPTSSIIHHNGTIVLPYQSSDVHHELEVVVLIGKRGKDIFLQDALAYVGGYGIGLDLTARDIQSRAKEKGHPWSVAKGFDTFAPVSDFLPAEEIDRPDQIEFDLAVNGEVRQHGNTMLMMFPIATLIAYLSTVFTLQPGDLIFTGTPEGVGPLNSGDRLTARMANRITLELSVR